jgi:hypothetical protein
MQFTGTEGFFTVTVAHSMAENSSSKRDAIALAQASIKLKRLFSKID